MTEKQAISYINKVIGHDYLWQSSFVNKAIFLNIRDELDVQMEEILDKNEIIYSKSLMRIWIKTYDLEYHQINIRDNKINEILNG